MKVIVVLLSVAFTVAAVFFIFPVLPAVNNFELFPLKPFFYGDDVSRNFSSPYCAAGLERVRADLDALYRRMRGNFFRYEAGQWLIVCLAGFFLGKSAQSGRLKVNYTRKIFIFTVFFSSLFLRFLFPFRGTIYLTFFSGLLFLAFIALLSGPVRRRYNFLAVIFSAIDRPEDRPHTLFWLFTQILFFYAAFILISNWLFSYGRPFLVSMTVFATHLGDGLAEPVGIRFGKHKYKTYAIFSRKKYIRTLEGSFCVFAAAAAAVLLLRAQLNIYEFIVLLPVFPAVMVLTEAFSPHTWDNPLLYLAGGVSTIVSLEIAKALFLCQRYNF